VSKGEQFIYFSVRVMREATPKMASVTPCGYSVEMLSDRDGTPGLANTTARIVFSAGHQRPVSRRRDAMIEARKGGK